MRWILIVLLMCNGIFFLWQNYLVQAELPLPSVRPSLAMEGGEALVLLSESPSIDKIVPQPQIVKSTNTLPQENSPPKSAASETNTPAMCWQIGPFKEEVTAKQVVNRLAALDISLQMKNIEISANPDYWVYIPPAPSRKAAIKLLRELQGKKIDSYLISEGELINGLSLGLFSQQDRAQAVYERRLKQGYKAKIKHVPRTHKELWAVFGAGEHRKFSEALWKKIQLGTQGLERRKNYCDRIASVDDFD